MFTVFHRALNEVYTKAEIKVDINATEVSVLSNILTLFGIMVIYVFELYLDIKF